MIIQPDEITFNEYDVLSSICKDSFFEFVKAFWPAISNDKPVWNWHIKYLCDEIQVAVDRVRSGLPRLYDLIVNVPPATTKSTIFSVMLPAWVWIPEIMPWCQILSASHSALLAGNLALKSRDIVESSLFKSCFSTIELRDDQKAKTNYWNVLGGKRSAFGVRGRVSGWHGHLLIVDDPIDPDKALEMSKRDVEVANNWLVNVFSQRRTSAESSLMIMVQQRVHPNDCTAFMLENLNGVRRICLPAEETDDVEPQELRSFYLNGLLDPTRLPRNVLDDKRQASNYIFESQYNQHPMQLGSGMFNINLIHKDILPPDPSDPKKWIKQVRYWDNATTKGAGCFSAGVKMGRDLDSRIWILDVKRGQWNSYERKRIQRETAENDGIHVISAIEQEPGSAGVDVANEFVVLLSGFRVEKDRPSGSKDLRADPYASQVNAGNVFLAPETMEKWRRPYLEELNFFPHGKYRDQGDASSGAFKIMAAKKGGKVTMWRTKK